MSSTTEKTAEEKFKEAFERLKKGKPYRVPAGSPVTQNNVAKEAGRDPSALKKDRYPLLVLEIQAYVASKAEQKKGSKRTRDNRARTDKQKVADYRRQIDKLSSIVAAQNSAIADLLDEIDELKSGKVATLSKDHGHNRG